MAPCLEHYNYSFAEATMSDTSLQSLTLANCRNVCPPECVSRSYFFYTSSIGAAATNVVRFEVHQNAFVYVVYETSLVMDLTALFSAFGATLGTV